MRKYKKKVLLKGLENNFFKLQSEPEQRVFNDIILASESYTCRKCEGVQLEESQSGSDSLETYNKCLCTSSSAISCLHNCSL